ncbi:MAG: hypothetical protein HY686_07185 [Chloroflexi bacterium]|nr:hypothetical protein [Chloroflexota bacterium]
MAKNIIQVDPAKFPWLDLRRYTFSMGAEKNGIVYLAGETASAYDPKEGKVLCKGDLLEQTKVIYEKLGVVLEAAGLSFENVVKTVDYINPVALPQYRQTGEIRRQYLGSNPVVVSTGICVHSLLRPDALLEVNAVAVRGHKQAVNPGYGRYAQLTYVPAVRTGEILWFSGTVGSQEKDGKRLYPQNTAQQVALGYQSLGPVLEAAGARPGDVVENLDYIDPQAKLQYRNVSRSRRDFYQGQYPAATGIIINRLLRPEGHVELELVAVTGEGRQEVRIPEWERRFRRLTHVPGVKKGRLLAISGQVAVDHATDQSVGGWDVVAQADQAYANIARVVAEAGYSMDDIINTLEFVTPNGVMGYRAVGDVRRKYFGKAFPAATGVAVHQLLRPELLIEVVALAVV